MNIEPREPKTKKGIPREAVGSNVITRGEAKVSTYDLAKVNARDGIPMEIFDHEVVSTGRFTYDVEVGDMIGLASPPSSQVVSSDFNPKSLSNQVKKVKHMTDVAFSAHAKKNPKTTVVEFYSVPIYNITARHIT